MAGKIFVNYRRDDGAANAARIRDRLANVFGASNVFMDVDNLLGGQRFDKEIENALAQCDVFLAVIGPRWLELLRARAQSGERDYVREEIAGALARGILVIPVLVERAALPRGDALPQNIRELVLHQKHDITHERFGRDVEDLLTAIRAGRKALRAESGGAGQPFAWRAIAAGLAALVFGGGVLAYQSGVPMPWTRGSDLDSKRQAAAEAEAARQRAAAENAKQEAAKRTAQEAERRRLAMLKAEDDARTKAAAEAAARRVPRVGETFRDCPDVCPEMVVVPAGEFTMGSNDGDAAEKPPRKVTIRQPFGVGKFEVTAAEWEACVAGGGCMSPSSEDRPRRPVTGVSWHDAQEYVAWLSRKTGKTYRLLTEAEWEYAARAGTTTKYAFGDTITKGQAQYSEGSWASARGTVDVGSFPANRFGLYDMHGNVWEWCEDNWHPNYQGAPQDGSVWAGGDASLRVARGGAWDMDPVYSANRGRVEPDGRGYFVGIRLARTL